MGRSTSNAFHLVIPSMPGYGFSGKPTTTGWGPARIARAWVELMKRLGYTQFVAQGGDWGAVITDVMATQAPPELLGIHSNMPGAVPPDVLKAMQSDGPLPSDLSADELARVRAVEGLFCERRGLRTRDGKPPTDAIRNCGFTRRSGRLDTRPRLA